MKDVSVLSLAAFCFVVKNILLRCKVHYKCTFSTSKHTSFPFNTNAYDIEWIVLHCDVTVPLNRPIMFCFIFLGGIKATESMSAGKNCKFWKCHKLLCLRQGYIHKIKGVVHVTVLTCDIQLLTVCSRLYGEAALYWSYGTLGV